MPKSKYSEVVITAAARDSLRAIEQLFDYQPTNPALSLPMLQQMEATLLAAETSEEQARLAYEQAFRNYQEARSVRRDTAKRFRHLIYHAKTHVVLQYGDDSYAVQKGRLEAKLGSQAVDAQNSLLKPEVNIAG